MVCLHSQPAQHLGQCTEEPPALALQHLYEKVFGEDRAAACVDADMEGAHIYRAWLDPAEQVHLVLLFTGPGHSTAVVSVSA